MQTLHRRNAGVTKDVREVRTSLVVWLYRNRGVCVGEGGVLKGTLFAKELGCPNEQRLGAWCVLTHLSLAREHGEAPPVAGKPTPVKP